MKKTGLTRIYGALFNSGNGLAFLIRHEAAFRQELVLVALLTPLAFYVGSSALEIGLLLAVLLLVLIVEIVNTAIEAVVDRIGPEYHELSGLAKDLGSAAVLLTIALAMVVWVAVAVG